MSSSGSLKDGTIISEEPQSLENVQGKRKWYRTTMFNAHVIGIVGLTAPGLWNAMNALGAGGAREPYLVNAANALVFGLMGIFCLLGATGSGMDTCTWSCRIPDLLRRFVYQRQIRESVVRSSRCSHRCVWVWWRTLGPIVGGAIVLALNNENGQRGHVSTDTYLIFIALQCLSVPVALALSPPEKVQRKDGTKVQPQAKVTLKQTFIDLWRCLQRREILLLLPIFSAAYFNSYSSTFASLYFSVRARALNGFLGNFPVLLGSQLVSHLLDYKGLSRKSRLVWGFWLVVITHILAWVYAVVIIADYRKNNPVLDWSHGAPFVRGFFVDVFWSCSKQILQTWLYYIMGTLTNDISELTRYTGILRGIESFAQAVAYGLNATKKVDAWVPVGINIALLVISVYPTWLVVRDSNPPEDEELLKSSSDKEKSSRTDMTHHKRDGPESKTLVKVATREGRVQ